MNKLFVDSEFWVTLSDPQEARHERAIELVKEFKRGENVLVTSNFVLDETFTIIRKRLGIYRVKKFRRVLSEFGNKLILERVTTGDEGGVWTWFWYDWKNLSYTDCASFALMRRLKLTKVATFDEHFEMAGFERVM